MLPKAVNNMRKYTIRLSDDKEEVVENVVYHASGNGLFYLWRNSERTGGFAPAHEPIPLDEIKDFRFVEMVDKK